MTETIAWKKIGAGINWALIHSSDNVAFLKSEGPLNTKFMASYNNKQIEIKQRKKPRGFEFREVGGDEFLGSIDTPFLSTTFWSNNGREYQIEGEGNLWYFKDHERKIAFMKYRRAAIFWSDAEFTLLDARNEDPDYRLIAIITLLIAIFDSFGLGDI